MIVFWSTYIFIYIISTKGLSLRFKDVDLDYDKQVSIIVYLNPNVFWRLFKKK